MKSSMEFVILSKLQQHLSPEHIREYEERYDATVLSDFSVIRVYERDNLRLNQQNQ
jgi:NADPH-dependent 7-cyano-7-deazaguanine reductase QueF-like protein